MGYYHSTYTAYGLHIPVTGPTWREAERIDRELPAVRDRCPDVGHLLAGPLAGNFLFLVTECERTELGSYGRSSFSPERIADWQVQLARAVSHLGYMSLCTDPPGWLCIPDLS